jgi:pSer/pThr/pTyr-binding forkhead associated (FHA) protein
VGSSGGRLDRRPSPADAGEEPTRVDTAATIGGFRGNDETVVIRPETATELGYLVIKSGVRAGQIVRLGPRTVLGRDAGADVRVDDVHMSGDHGSIKLEDDNFVYRDHGSTNGSWLLGPDGPTRIDVHVLADHDRLRLGTSEFGFLHVRKDVPQAEGGSA